MRIIAVLFLALILSSCAGNPIPITKEMVSETGETTRVVTHYVADASVAKEEAVHSTLKARDNAIVQDGKNSGMKMDWTTVEETIEIPGQQTITMKRAMPVISFKERARFEQKLPTEPSIHPGYAMTERIVGHVATGTVIGLGIKEGAGVIKSALSKAGNSSSQTVNAETFTDNRVDNRIDVSNSGAESQISATGAMQEIPEEEAVLLGEVPAETSEIVKLMGDAKP